MFIDLNNPQQPTMESTRKLIASGDDTGSAQYRVSKRGVAYVEQDVIGEDRLEGVLYRSETLGDGTGYLGPEAANDPQWVQEIYEDLKKLQKAYKSPRRVYVDGYEGPYIESANKSFYLEYTPDETGLVDWTQARVRRFGV